MQPSLLRLGKIKVPGTASVQDFSGARHITLSRPGSLNSLTLPMMRDLYFYYISSPPQNENAFYILRGEGDKAFSAGGDILSLTDPSRPHYAEEYYQREYQVDYHIATMPRSQIALWRGIVFGSGVGVSLHGSHRIACENTVLGMPETKIGAVPDVGGTWRFRRCTPSFLGAYFLLTGSSVKGADAYYLGLATHYVPSLSQMNRLEEELTRLRSVAAISECLRAYTTTSALPPFSYAGMWETLQRAFTITPDTTVASIMNTLKQDGSPPALATLQLMEHNSPLAMTLALENWKRQETLTDIRQAFEIDYGLTSEKGILEVDFESGVRELLIRRSKKKPHWQHSHPQEVDITAVRDVLARGKDFSGTPRDHASHTIHSSISTRKTSSSTGSEVPSLGRALQQMRAPASAVEEARAPASTVVKMRAPASAVEEAQAPASTVVKMRAPVSAVEEAQAPASTVVKMRAPASAVEEARAPASAVEGNTGGSVPKTPTSRTGAPSSSTARSTPIAKDEKKRGEEHGTNRHNGMGAASTGSGSKSEPSVPDSNSAGHSSGQRNSKKSSWCTVM